jgi:hypothetical protein
MGLFRRRRAPIPELRIDPNAPHEDADTTQLVTPPSVSPFQDWRMKDHLANKKAAMYKVENRLYPDG